MGSVLAHAALVGAAVAATGRAAAPRPTAPERADLVFVASRAEAAPPAAAPPARATAGPGPRAAPAPRARPAVDMALPPVGAPTIDVDVGGPARVITWTGDFDANALTRPPGSAALGGSGTGGAPYPEALVDEPVVPDPRNPPPRYPEALRAAGTGGRVVARFVVDTLGRVEAGSVAFPSADDPRLADAARDALVRARFRPARAGGRRVRQLVEWPFVFTPAGQP